METPESIETKRRLQDSATAIAAAMLAGNPELVHMVRNDSGALKERIAIHSVELAKRIQHHVEKD